MQRTDTLTKWTEEQRAAIRGRGEILVAAAAGSGKTAVLIERILRLITDPVAPVDIDHLLVVTFTNAAAQEMRERMRAALEKQLFAQEGAQGERLMRQLALLSHSHITTLHSFCLELLRQYFYLLDLDPGFRVADEIETALLRQEVMDTLFDSRYEKNDPVFLQLVECLGTDRDDHTLAEQILRIYFFAYSQAYPQTWLDALPDAYQWDNGADFLQSPWGQALLAGVKEDLILVLATLQQAKRLCCTPGGPLHYLSVIAAEADSVDHMRHLIAKAAWEEWEKEILNFTFAPLPRSKKKSKGDRGEGKDEAENEVRAEALREEVKTLRNQVKKQIALLKKNFAFTLEQQIPALAAMKDLAAGLAALAGEFSRLYDREKRNRNIVDFTDMEHYTLRLLEQDGRPTAIADHLKTYFREILVDEYQDINPAQERILSLLTRQDREDPNYFMVGDVKQSIYRFRMADPTLFLDKYNAYPHWTKEHKAQGAKSFVIDLARNFRSRKEIVSGVNALFQTIMNPASGEIEYDERAALKYGAAYPDSGTDPAGGPVELHLIAKEGSALLSGRESRENNEEENPVDGEQENLTGIQREARLVAQHVQRLVTRQELFVYDKPSAAYRPVRYRDIVILMRSYAALAPVFTEEFKNAGIPVYSANRQGYFAATEVELILSLLKIIDNPRLDIALAAVLRSPIVGLSGEELGYVRSLLPRGDYYEALSLLAWAKLGEDELTPALRREFEDILQPYADALDTLGAQARQLLAAAAELGEKVGRFWQRLQAWRTYSRQFSLSDLIWFIYQDTGYLTYVGTLAGGEKRQANLKLLYDRARRFEANHYRGLFRFLRFIEKFTEQSQDWGEADTLSEKEDVVRFLTVHGSKGLEFPVVFFVGLGQLFNTSSLQEPVLLHPQLGLGLPVMDLANRVYYPSLVRQAVQKQLQREARAEEMRILYVALTRAKEKLYLYGSMKNVEEKWQHWKQADPLVLNSARCFLEWVGPALARREDPSSWLIEFHQQSIPPSAASSPPNPGAKPVPEPETRRDFWRKEIEARLDWEYPYRDEVNIPAKTSVSELKRNLIWYADDAAVPAGESVLGQGSLTSPLAADRSFPAPLFLQSKVSLSAAEKGTALHTFLQHLPFSGWKADWNKLSEPKRTELVKSHLLRMVGAEVLSPEQARTVDCPAVVRLLDSGTGQRLFSAAEVRKEIPFTLQLRRRKGGQPFLVQGIIDVILVDRLPKSLEIIDYKTDRLSAAPAGEETLLERYALQIGLYALACERLLHRPVSSSTLYSFSLGREVPVSRPRWEGELSRIFWLEPN